MKLRAPRCSEARSSTELPARQLSQCTAELAVASAAAGSAAASASGATNRIRTAAANLAMVRDSLGYRLDRIDARIKRHQPEVREIRHREDARHRHVGLLCRLHPQVHEHQERNRE